MVSPTEQRHLLVSWLTLSVAFAILLSNFSLLGFLAGVPLSFSDFFSMLLVSLVATGTGFVLHELAHKYTAQRYGAAAEFRMWEPGLALAVLLPLFTPFFFAAPGAVWVYGPHLSVRQNGWVSLAGPLTNVAVALAFLALLLLLPAAGLAGAVLAAGFRINLWLAFFNLIPFPPLDGSKVIAWSPAAWGALFLPLLFLFFFPLAP